MDNDSNYQPMLCTGMWTAATALMAYASVTDFHAAAWWALMLALGACLFTGRVILTNAVAKERIRIEEIAAIVASEMNRSDDVTTLRR